MNEKYLQQLTHEEAKELIFQSAELKEFITEELWMGAKYNGTRLVKIAEENETVNKKAAELLKLDDSQMQCLITYLKSHYPYAKLGAQLNQSSESVDILGPPTKMDF